MLDAVGQRSRLRAVAFVLALSSVGLGAVLVSSPASGQKPPASSNGSPVANAGGAPADRHDPDNVAGISQFMETLGKGTEKYLAKDYPAAVDLYKKAIQLNPRNPLGSYLLGEAHLATGNLGGAEAAFKAADEQDDQKRPLVRSHVLFAVADVYERQKKYDRARGAWQTYTDHAAKIGGTDGGAFPQSGAARIKVLDDALKRERQYEGVRARIAAEKIEKADGGTASATSAAKPSVQTPATAAPPAPAAPPAKKK